MTPPPPASAACSSLPPMDPPGAPIFSIEFERLRAKLATYLRPDEVAQVEKAYLFSAEAHKHQTRQSGEPYIIHPVAVAGTLADWHLDAQALMAALLHDVMEDSGVSKQELAERFGKVASDLVDGVSKLERLAFQSQEEAQAENFRKMLLAMARDVRVILIKLADRLHNMQTLDCVRPAKQRRVARETMEIYSPIANRLGLNTLYRELQELSFQYLHPMRHRVLAKAVKAARGNRREVVGKILGSLKKRLPEYRIDAQVFGREKTLHSIYRKMVEKHLSFSQVLDIYGFRIVVKDIPTCYLALGALHGLYKPVPGKFKDYIAIPKANGYQSLHTTLIGPYGTPIEVQIRTDEMHRIAQAGVASHWLYKGDESLRELQRKTHNWLQSLLEIQNMSRDSAEFLEHVKIDLFPGEVFVFTPKGKIVALPRGSTAVDFAYAVHTDVGHRCVACRINHELMPLRSELKNGDQVEIITAVHANPNPAWLSYVRTGKARSQIRHFLKSMHREQSAHLGEQMLRQALEAQGATLQGLDDLAWERVIRDAGARSRLELLEDVGLGKRAAAVLARRLLARDETRHDGRAEAPVLIRGSEGVAINFARCCRPIPGDAIIGSIKKGQGLVVHTLDCSIIRKSRNSEPNKWIEVDWQLERERQFEVRVQVLAENRRGVLARVAAAIAEAESNIEAVSMEEEQGVYTSLFFTVQVSCRVHLARLMRSVRHVPEVTRISRVKNEV